MGTLLLFYYSFWFALILFLVHFINAKLSYFQYFFFCEMFVVIVKIFVSFPRLVNSLLFNYLMILNFKIFDLKYENRYFNYCLF